MDGSQRVKSERTVIVKRKTRNTELKMVSLLQVMVDNVIQEIPGNGDYPKFMEKEHKQKFIFRFPKAMNRILYDPGLEVGEDSSAVNIMPAQSLAFVMFINCFAFFF